MSRSNYNYVLRVVEQPCQPTSRPVTKALKYDEVGGRVACVLAKHTAVPSRR